MDGKMLARLGAIVFVAVAITATAIEMTRKEEEPAGQVAAASFEAPRPIRCARRSGRCQLLGEAAARDAECLRTWAETATASSALRPRQHRLSVTNGR